MKAHLKLLSKDIKKNYSAYLLVLPVILFYAYFSYVPMYGAVIAFKDYSPALGIVKSPFVGLEHFRNFFSSVYFLRVLKNTINISLTGLLFGFPAPIILALLISELTKKWFARTVQTITYLPHFISLVVICGMISQFTTTGGIIQNIYAAVTGNTISMLNDPKLFVPIYVVSGIWQEVGWGSIIYLAALSAVDHELYEAATIDGAGRLKQIFAITLPSIMPTIVTLFILRLGSALNVGHEKIILLYNPMTYETSDVISSFVYRAGLQSFKYDYATAVGLFNSVINFAIVLSANYMSKKINNTSLW
ncbi:MAG: ABC transporter permease subunit [Firmicutes bacterium]|nr:ABC transporter permease subunit [Bacillota bacterium]